MSLDIEELMGEANRIKDEENKGGGNNFMSNFVRMPDKAGHVTVRLLPPAKAGMFDRPKNSLFQGTRTHKVNGKSFHCPRNRIKKPDGQLRWDGDCPICSYYSSLWKRIEKLPKNTDERTKMEKKARDIKPTERYYYNCIVRQQFNPETNQMETNIGPKILSVGITVHTMIVNGITGNKELDEPGLGDVTHVTTGRDFKIIKSIKKSPDGEFPAYDGSKFLDPSPLGTPEQVETWLSSLHDLAALRKLEPTPTLERQLQIHNGVIKDDSETFDYSKFEKAEDTGVSIEVEQEEVKPAAVKTEAKKPTPASKPTPAPKKEVEPTPDPVLDKSEGDEALPEEDFMAELRNM